MASRSHPTSLQTPEIVIYFICRIESSYPNERILFVANFCAHFISRIDEYVLHEESPSNDTIAFPIHKEKHRFYTDEDIYNTIKNAPFHHILYLFAPYIIHNRFMSPFKDVRDSLSKFIQHLNDKLHISMPQSSPPYPLSGFLELTSTKCPYECVNNDDNEYGRIYTNFGRISHFQLLISSHNKFLNNFNDLFHFLMNANNGPLGQDKRQYLGLMAASRYSCKYIIMQCELNYRKLNGDMTWIKSGINSAPAKYAKMAKINAMLSHQPWLITAQHIAELVHGNGAWTVSECVQSFLILIMYHFLCGMHRGLCLTPEIDLYYASTLQSIHTQQSLHDVFSNVLDDTLGIQSGIDALQLSDEDEDQQSQNIAKLLSHTQQQLLQDVNVVGVKKQGFEHSACLNLEMDTVSEARNATRSCFIRFRQLSDSGNDEEHDGDSRSLSMEYDPDMAPPSLSNTEIKQDIDGNANGIKDEEKKCNDNDVHKLTSSDWKQLITLRKENMFPMNSYDENRTKEKTNEYWDTAEQKLATITNPQKTITNGNGNKKRKYAKIKAPSSQGTEYWKYSLGIDMMYKDFDCHKNYQIHAYDFNWDKHGYALLSRYYPGIEKKMDSVFKTAYTMTDHCINDKDNLDTEPFRLAVWHYTFRLFGVHNDSYEYRFVNIYLPIKLKIFIKKLVCYPQIVTIDDVKKMGVALKEREKIHVAILALEAKKQASLLFALRAIMKYMQSN